MKYRLWLAGRMHIGARHHIPYIKHLFTAGLLFVMSACSSPYGAFDMNERWLAYYDTKADDSDLHGYDLVVLDKDAHPEFKDLNTTVLAYLSVGEMDNDIARAESLPEKLMIASHSHWNSSIIDVRYPEWYESILKVQIPAIKEKGFDGVMLDTVDSPIYLESQDPQKYAGMSDALTYLVKAIRYYHPEMKIMVNRGFSILPAVAEEIDMVLAESILSNYDLKENKAANQPDDVYQHYVKKLSDIMSLNPKIKVYTLDYWDMNDTEGVARIYDAQRKNGFVPYVTTPDLRTIHHEDQASVTTLGGNEGVVHA